MAYSGNGAWVSLSGTARIVNDTDKLRELWSSFTGSWLEGGPENPNNVLIEIDADSRVLGHPGRQQGHPGGQPDQGEGHRQHRGR